MRVSGWFVSGAIDSPPLAVPLLHPPHEPVSYCMVVGFCFRPAAHPALLSCLLSPAPLGASPPQSAAGKWIGAICASPPVVLAAHGLLPPTATWYPSVGDTLGDTRRGTTRVVVDDGARVVTSQGPATAIEFGLAVAGVVGVDAKVVASVRDQLLVDV